MVETGLYLQWISLALSNCLSSMAEIIWDFTGEWKTNKLSQEQLSFKDTLLEKHQDLFI